MGIDFKCKVSCKRGDLEERKDTKKEIELFKEREKLFGNKPNEIAHGSKKITTRKYVRLPNTKETKEFYQSFQISDCSYRQD